nr:myb-like protein V [Ipomoea batatas]
MDVESTFRVMFGVKKEQDMVELIEAAVNVAALIDPHKLKKHRSRIVKLLFDEDPANSTHDLFSDDDDELLKVTSTPTKNKSHSPEIKKLGFKKSVEVTKKDRSKAKPPRAHNVQQLRATLKTELKVRPNGKPKPKSKY